jgi:transposase
MTATVDPFAAWLFQASIPETRLTLEQRALLQAVFRFRQRQGDDYYSTRLLSHFLLHCDTGLTVAQLARLLGVSRPTASRQQGLSAKQAIQQAHHRMDGRPYGKLLPRYAGPIAGFLLGHPEASRHDTLDFIDQTFGVRVSTVALSKFLKKYGLDAARRQATAAPAPSALAAAPLSGPALGLPAPPTWVVPPGVPGIAQGQPVPTPAPPFSAPARSTRAPSCCCRRPSPG